MKLSNIILTITLLIILGVIGIYVNNENSEFKDFEMYPELKGQAYSLPPIDVQKRTFEFKKTEKRNEILKTGGILILLSILTYGGIAIFENKKDPKRNLATLKEKNIITQSEYDEKIEHSKKVANEKKALGIKKREYKKLVSELDNLKAKGILSEEEYQEKLIKIEEKTA